MRFTHGRPTTAIVAVAILAVATAATDRGPSFAAAGERHVIKITPDPADRTNWSATADLRARNGNVVYHWQEAHFNGTDYVRWEYTDGVDGAWIDLYIHPSDIQFAQYLHLDLGANHCYRIVPDPDNPSFASAVEDSDCPFDW
jgi:hypothetical protein